MRRKISLHLVAFSITLVLAFAIPTGRALSEPDPGGPQPGSDEVAFAPGRILVKVKDNASADALASVNRKNDAHLEEKIPHSRVSVVDLPKGLSVAEAVEAYEASPEVEYAEPDYEVYPEAIPNDPSFPKMHSLNNTSQNSGGTSDADIDAPEAWSVTTGSVDTVVAVIDTGADINHPDLDDNVWTNPDEIAANNKDDDMNGYVDDVHGWDFASEDSSVFDGAEADAHGTHVAGTIAAEGNNAVGVTGVNWQAKIMPLKFIGPTGHMSDAIEALNYAVANGAKISNNSWGGYTFSQAMLDAINSADAAGHLFIASAGNSGKDNDAAPRYPSGYDSPNIIAVAATDEYDALTSFSNYGATSVDLAAPGESILSTLPDNTYGYYWGTSMATPHVSGTAALVKSNFPDLNDTEIKAKILQTVDVKTTLQDKTLSGGRLNAARALGVNTAPVILDVRPRGKIRDQTPTIRITVRDEETELAKTQIELYLDGQQIQSFFYDQIEDRLAYNSRRLSFGRHSVRVVAEDGEGLERTHAWEFRVVRRR